MTLEEVTEDYDIANDDNYTDASASDSESELGDDGDDALDETLYERLAALKDIVPPPTRARISSAVSSGKSGLGTVALFGGKTLWAITSSLLLIGIPFMMAVEAEAQAQEEEKALSMQTGNNDLLGGGMSDDCDHAHRNDTDMCDRRRGIPSTSCGTGTGSATWLLACHNVDSQSDTRHARYMYDNLPTDSHSNERCAARRLRLRTSLPRRGVHSPNVVARWASCALRYLSLHFATYVMSWSSPGLYLNTGQPRCSSASTESSTETRATRGCQTSRRLRSRRLLA